MAKTSSELVKMESTAGTGYFYVKRRNRRSTKKLELKKYDPRARKHVLFVEKKLK